MVDPIFYEKLISIAAAAIDFAIIWYCIEKLTGKSRA